MSATVALREMPPDMFGKRVLGDSGQAVAARIGDRSGVADLGGDSRALGMHCISERAQSRQCFVGPQDLVRCGAAVRRGRAQ